MKILSILSLSIVLLLSSCSKTDENTSSGTMTLKKDGVDWSASLTVKASNTNNILTVSGSDNGGKQCQIVLQNISSTGTYDLGGSTSNQNYGRWTNGTQPTDTYSTMAGIGSGKCTITELTSTKVSGTFNFSAKNTAGNSVNITSGSFSSSF